MGKKKRPYVLRARAQRLAETRARIVEAAMRLHQELGPRHTTVSAIAKRAGVERLTVYRHFRDDAEIFAACSGRYLELNPPPYPGLWADETDPARRTQRGLEAIFGFFSRTAPMFEKVYRDVEESKALEKIMEQFGAHLRSLADDLATAWLSSNGSNRSAVILRHAAKFATWQSLGAEGLGDREKAALIVEWLNGAVAATRPEAAKAGGEPA